MGGQAIHLARALIRIITRASGRPIACILIQRDSHGIGGMVERASQWVMRLGRLIGDAIPSQVPGSSQP